MHADSIGQSMGAAGAVLYIFCGRTPFLARSGFLSLIPLNRTIINMKVLQISFVIALAACTFSMVTAVPVPLGAGFEKVIREGASAEEDGIASLTDGLRKLEIKPPRRLASEVNDPSAPRYASGGAEKARSCGKILPSESRPSREAAKARLVPPPAHLDKSSRLVSGRKQSRSHLNPPSIIFFKMRTSVSLELGFRHELLSRSLFRSLAVIPRSSTFITHTKLPKSMYH